MDLIIAGDIGGTKTDLALYSLESGIKKTIRREKFRSSGFESLEDIVSAFVKQSTEAITLAVFAVAGPVRESIAKITNLPWIIDSRHLSSATGISQVHLLNDLEAAALGVTLLETKDLHMINKGQPSPQGPVAVIAPGTGLGEAYLTWNGSRYIPHASEGGHSDFAPRNALEIALLEYLLERHAHVSYEHICSGSGIPNIYNFLRDRGYQEEPAWLTREMRNATDQTALIIDTAKNLARKCLICKDTLKIFVSILGAETGNMALKIIPTGGIYLGGGIPPRILGAFLDKDFIESFLEKGRLSHILEHLPIHIVLNTDTALMGAASYGIDLMKIWKKG